MGMFSEIDAYATAMDLEKVLEEISEEFGRGAASSESLGNLYELYRHNISESPAPINPYVVWFFGGEMASGIPFNESTLEADRLQRVREADERRKETEEQQKVDIEQERERYKAMTKESIQEMSRFIKESERFFEDEQNRQT